MLAPEDLARHAELSPIQVTFLEHAARNPEWSAPETFDSLSRIDEYLPYVPQPWPLFLDRRRFEEMGRVAVAVCRLIQKLPVRVFANDPRRLAEFYGLPIDRARLASDLIAKTDCLLSTVGRGDFLGSPGALKCCEFNMAGNLGGYQIVTWEERYLALAPVQRFLAENGLRGTMVVPTLRLFSHLIDDARRHGLAADGTLNTVVVLDSDFSAGWEAYLDRHYRAVLAERGGLEGNLRACRPDELREKNGLLTLRGWPVQALIDTVMGKLGRDSCAAQLAGSTRVFNGELSELLSDKLNFALLSELADADLWSEDEKETIRKHVPWSRRVVADFTDFAGERVYLPDLLVDRRERMVLKLGTSMAGESVHLGRVASAARWSEQVEKALAEPGWMVQERVDTPTYVFPSPEGELMPHEIVWGLFAIGDDFSGGFVRMTPAGRSTTGVINGSLFGGRGGPVIAVEPLS